MKEQFSKGPWEIEHKIEDGDNIWWVNTPYVEPAAAKCFNPWNAQLVASSPDMYDALEEAVEAMGYALNYVKGLGLSAEDLLNESIKKAKKTLSKAQGLEDKA